MFHLCVCLALFQFRVIFTINVVERNVVAYCHAYIYGLTDQSCQTGPNESALHFKTVFIVC